MPARTNGEKALQNWSPLSVWSAGREHDSGR